MIFAIPSWEFSRIDAIVHNKQSYLLQEVKDVLLGTFPNTDIRGDGPVVKVPFSTYEFEVCPVFQLKDGSFINAHTKNGGRWGHTHPAAEINWLNTVDARSSNKATHLVRMLKAWQRECNVDIRSICLETLAILFIDQWRYRDQVTLVWYDWMMRDFFNWAHQYSTGGIIKPAGIDEWIPAGEWQSKCMSAYLRSVKACEYEHQDNRELANAEWQKIFGSQFRNFLSLSPIPPPPLYTGLLAGRT